MTIFKWHFVRWTKGHNIASQQIDIIVEQLDMSNSY